MKPPAAEPSRWRCLCAYDGTRYVGWQRQPEGESVQSVIGEALALTFAEDVRTVGAGRTDAGVHAEGQVFHFDAAWRHGPEKLLKALRSRLPEDVSVWEVRTAGPGFHALRSARGKRYVYRAVEGWASPRDVRFVHSLEHRRMDVEAMRAGAAHLVGAHDFSAFAANRGYEDGESPVKDLWRLDVKRSGRRVTITAEGGGFLYKMVRSLAGALFDVGAGKLKPADLRSILASRKRTAVVVSAPARGLTLEKVYYRKPGRP